MCKGYKGNLENHIGTSNGLYWSSNIEKQPSTSVCNKKSSKVIQLYKSCFEDIGKGKLNSCKIVKGIFLEVVEKLPEKQQDQIVTTLLKNKTSLRGK